MLTTDVETAKERVKASMASVATVTGNAQATVTTVPIVPNPPDWYTPIQKDLSQSQVHAKDWLSRICPSVTSTIPGGMTTFNDTFQSTSARILEVLNTAGGGSPLTQDQRDAVDSSLSELTTAIGAQEQAVVSLLTNITSYFTAIDNDQDVLQTDLGTVSARFADSGVWIQKMTTAMNESFLSTTVLGPCDVIVEIDMNVSLQLGGIGTDPTLNALVIAKATLQNQIASFQATQQAVQGILDTWTTLKIKADAVVMDLKDAKDDEQYVAVLTQLDLETAQDQWQQLADFASGLTNSAARDRQRLRLTA